MTAIEFKNTVIPSYGAMLALGRHILGAREAEDVVQDVLKTLWEKHETINTNDGRSYALRSVRNRCLDIAKRRREEVEMIENAFTETDDSDEKQEEVLDYMEKLSKLEDAIKTLKEPSKTVIKMNMNGESSETISSVTGLSEQNVRQILSRTRRRLREILKV